MELIIINTEETGDVYIATTLDSFEVFQAINSAIYDWRADPDCEITPELIEAQIKKTYRGSGCKVMILQKNTEDLNF
jgi:hypothetical protein